MPTGLSRVMLVISYSFENSLRRATPTLKPLAEINILSLFASYILRLPKCMNPVNGFTYTQPVLICLPVYFTLYFSMRYFAIGEVNKIIAVSRAIIMMPIVRMVFFNFVLTILKMDRFNT